MIGKFTITGKLAGLNELLKEANRHYAIGNRLKRDETVRCGYSVIAGSVPTFTTPVVVRFRWIEPDLRRDPDNVTCGQKFALDALVELGRIPNDSRKWIKAISHEFPAPDPRNPRVEVEIETLETGVVSS